MIIRKVEAFKYFNKLTRARTENNKKIKAESKKKQKRRNHCAESRKKPRERPHFAQ